MKVVLLQILLFSMLTPAFSKTFIRGLGDASSVELKNLVDSKKLFILFKPNCFACLKQIRNLGCFKESDVALLGAFSSQKDLMREYIKMKRPEYSAYYADPEVLKYFKVTNASTPQLFIKHQKKWMRKLGYTDCKMILRYL